MIHDTSFFRQREEFRQEAMVEDHDGRLYLTLHGSLRQSDAFKRPFDFRSEGTLDDGDPFYLSGV